MLFSRPVAAAEDGHAPRMGREEHGRLPRRVARTDDVDVQAVACSPPRCAPRRRDALPGEPVEPVDRQLPPGDAAGEDDRPRPQDVTAVEVHLTRRGVDPRDRPGHEDLRAEPPRLLQRAARQLVSRHAGREAEVVLDPRRRAGLAAGRLPLDHDRAQALRRAVHGRGQPGGARRRRSPCRTRRRPARCRGRAARPPGGAAVARPSCRRRPESPGSPPRPAEAPPHCSAASGASGVSHLNVIWLRSRKRRSSAQDGIPPMPDHDRARRRRLGCDALQPARSADPVALPACRPPCRRPAPRPRQRGSREARPA